MTTGREQNKVKKFKNKEKDVEKKIFKCEEKICKIVKKKLTKMKS